MKRSLGVLASVMLVLSLVWALPAQADPEDDRVDASRLERTIRNADDLIEALEARKADVSERVRQDYDDLLEEARLDRDRAKRRQAAGDGPGALDHAEAAVKGLREAEGLAPVEGGGR